MRGFLVAFAVVFGAIVALSCASSAHAACFGGGRAFVVRGDRFAFNRFAFNRFAFNQPVVVRHGFVQPLFFQQPLFFRNRLIRGRLVRPFSQQRFFLPRRRLGLFNFNRPF